ncbi:hypothetical protein AOLI_G00192640 [Acnodon oligacanthus]
MSWLEGTCGSERPQPSSAATGSSRRLWLGQLISDFGVLVYSLAEIPALRLTELSQTFKRSSGRKEGNSGVV